MLISNISCTNLGQNKRIHTHRHFCKSPMNKQINLKPKNSPLTLCFQIFESDLCSGHGKAFQLLFLLILLICLFAISLSLETNRVSLVEKPWPVVSWSLGCGDVHTMRRAMESHLQTHLHPSHAPGCES